MLAYNLFCDNTQTDNEIEFKKQLFLHSIKAKNGNYKRFLCTPLRYGGGKSLAVGLIIEHFPKAMHFQTDFLF